MFILVLVFLGVTMNALATTEADFYDLKPKTGYIVRQIESILPQGIVIAHLRHYDDPSEHHFRDVSETREIDFNLYCASYCIRLYDAEAHRGYLNMQCDAKIYFIEGTNTVHSTPNEYARDNVASNALFQAFLFVHSEQDDRWASLRTDLKKLFEQESFITEFVKSGALDGYPEEMRDPSYWRKTTNQTVQAEVVFSNDK